MTEQDLKLTPTEDLLDEVLSRFEHAVFGGMRCDEHAPETCSYKRRWKGNIATCMGLALKITYDANGEWEEDAIPLPDEAEEE